MDGMQLLWTDPRSAQRICHGPPSRAVASPSFERTPILPHQSVPSKSAAELLAILVRSSPLGGDGVTTAVARAVRADGKFAPPVLFVEGDVQLSLAELEALKATVATAMPFASNDAPLRDAIIAARDVLSLPDLVLSSAAVDDLANSIRTAFRRTRREVPNDYIDAQVERVLMSNRLYSKRPFLGTPHIAARLRALGGPMWHVVLPEASALQLPLTGRFRARLAVEAHLIAEDGEGASILLRAVAVARRVGRG